MRDKDIDLIHRFIDGEKKPKIYAKILDMTLDEESIYCDYINALKLDNNELILSTRQAILKAREVKKQPKPSFKSKKK